MVLAEDVNGKIRKREQTCVPLSAILKTAFSALKGYFATRYRLTSACTVGILRCNSIQLASGNQSSPWDGRLHCKIPAAARLGIMPHESLFTVR